MAHETHKAVSMIAAPIANNRFIMLVFFRAGELAQAGGEEG
jgi:hypothetical protein